MRRTLAVTLVLLAVCGCATTPEQRRLAGSHHDLGDQLLREGKYVEAMPELLAAAEIDPHDATIQLSLGVSYRSRGLPVEAEKALHRALELAPDSAEAHQTLGALLLQLGRYDEAIAELDIAAKDLRYQSPHYACTNLGNAYLGKNEPGKAIEWFKRALQTVPGFWLAQRGLGNAYYLVGRFDEAATNYRAAMAAHPTDVESRIGIGRCEMKQGRLKDARQAFQGAVASAAAGSEMAKKAQLYLDRLDSGVVPEP
ncbi:MAG: tetratricopeptide repeat protein [Pseudomonadota bacterium]